MRRRRCRIIVTEQVTDGVLISLGLDLDAQRGGKLAGKFDVMADMAQGGMTNDRSAAFFGCF